MSRQLRTLAGLAIGFMMVSSAIANTIEVPPLPSVDAKLCIGACEVKPDTGLTGDLIPILSPQVDKGFDNVSLLPDGKPIGDRASGLRVTLLTVSGNVNPFQTLMISVTDFDEPSPFAISLSLPIIPPINLPANVSTALSGSCMDDGADGCGVVPFLSPPHIAEFFVNGFADSLTGFERGAAELIATPGGSFSGPTFGTISGVFDCTAVGGCTSFETLISFIGSGGGDVITLTARFEINQIPEPSTLSLLVLGLLGMGAAMWRRRRSS